MSEKQKKKNIRKLIAAGAAALLIVLLLLLELLLPYGSLLPPYPLPPREEGTVRLHFLYVGQGDATVVEFSEGDILVVDGGDGGFSSRNHLIRYIKGLHPSSVALLATHADRDHFNGLVYLLRAFDVSHCYLPHTVSASAEYASLLRETEREGCAVETFSRYTQIERENGYLLCLSPRSGEDAGENDGSAVLYLQFCGQRALLCGDITASREKLLLSEYLLDLDGGSVFDHGALTVRLGSLDLLKAAHHGSDGSSCEEWLRLLSPKKLVVSCGRGNAYSHPAGAALARYRAACPEGEIYRTDELGDLIFTMGGSHAATITEGVV